MSSQPYFEFHVSLTSATGRTALCVSTLFPDVGGLRINFRGRVSEYLVRMGLVPDDVIVGDAALVDLVPYR